MIKKYGILQVPNKKGVFNMAKSETKASNDKYRAQVVEKIRALFVELGEDVQQTASNKIAFPFVNDLQGDEWIEITVSVPLGSRKDNTPFDGYEQAQDFQTKTAENEKRAKSAAEAKAKKIAFDKKKREIAAKQKEESGE